METIYALLGSTVPTLELVQWEVVQFACAFIAVSLSIVKALAFLLRAAWTRLRRASKRRHSDAPSHAEPIGSTQEWLIAPLQASLRAKAASTSAQSEESGLLELLEELQSSASRAHVRGISASH